MAEVTSNTPGAVWNKTKYRWEKKKKPGSLWGTGSQGSYQDPAMPEQGPYSFPELTVAENIKKKVPPNLGGGNSIWSGLKNLFGGGSDDDDETETETKGKGTGTDWNKWLTFGKGIMDWNTSQKEIELGKEQNRLGWDQLAFKRDAYAGEVERKDTEYYDQVNNVNQQRKFLNLWLDKQGREADRVGYLKNKNYSLPA